MRERNVNWIMAIVLAVVGAASVFLMLHHPTLGSPGHASLAHEVRAEEAVNTWVHGTLIALILVYQAAAMLLARRIGGGHWFAALGKTAIALATILMVLAALMSGFVSTSLAHDFAALPDGGGSSFHLLIALTSTFNQVFANTSTVAYGAAILFLSLPLIGGSMFERGVGIFGAVLGAVFVLGIISGHLVLNVPGMTSVIAGMGVWFALAGVVLARPASQEG